MTAFTQTVQLVTPFLTFGLGYATKSYADRQERKRLLVTEIVTLSLEWYEQLRKLLEEIDFGTDSEKLARQEFEYLTNRNVLPRYIALLMRLRRSRGGRNSEFYDEARAFLRTLTIAEGFMREDIDLGDYVRDFTPPEFATRILERLTHVNEKRARKLLSQTSMNRRTPAVLQSLDRRIQRMAALSGNTG